jgi:hypothetical protein
LDKTGRFCTINIVEIQLLGLCETACFAGLILALHTFAHFLHIARMDNRCKDVQAMQRMQQNNNGKITAIRLKRRFSVE